MTKALKREYGLTFGRGKEQGDRKTMKNEAGKVGGEEKEMKGLVNSLRIW